MATGLPEIKSARSAELLDALQKHEAQAAALRAAYGAAMAVDADGMLYWIAEAAKELRLGAGRKLVHPAASGNMDQSTLYRFERHIGQPESIDATVAAYADDLDLSSIEIWERALEMWRAAIEAGEAAGARPAEVAADVVARLAKAGGSRPPQAPARSPRRAGGPGRKSA